MRITTRICDLDEHYVHLFIFRFSRKLKWQQSLKWWSCIWTILQTFIQIWAHLSNIDSLVQILWFLRMYMEIFIHGRYEIFLFLFLDFHNLPVSPHTIGLLMTHSPENMGESLQKHEGVSWHGSLSHDHARLSPSVSFPWGTRREGRGREENSRRRHVTQFKHLVIHNCIVMTRWVTGDECEIPVTEHNLFEPITVHVSLSDGWACMHMNLVLPHAVSFDNRDKNL